MKLFIATGAFLLMAAVLRAAGVQQSTVPVVTAIDTSTVQSVTTRMITVDELTQQKQAVQAQIDYAMSEQRRLDDQYAANISYWQEQLKQIAAMIFTATGK